ncbi:hypothetical protein [Rhizobium sp. PEPV16]|uniref:hypothetical protein n=1 Tax=Rhizobium sp. PEPV16 TaxID=1820614 RepID=UPI00124E3EF9|nr:hypothetical protein [Rhizobium sp. PEPV16]KAF5885880.1 hypothetical protein FY112_09365 [Rhizobium sp. PEPV16]
MSSVDFLVDGEITAPEEQSVNKVDVGSELAGHANRAVAFGARRLRMQGDAIGQLDGCRIAGLSNHGWPAPREDVNFKNDCDCSGGGGSAPAPVTVAAPAKEPASLMDDPVQWAKENPIKATVAGVAAGVVTGGAIYYGGAAVAALLGGGALMTAAAQ